MPRSFIIFFIFYTSSGNPTPSRERKSLIAQAKSQMTYCSTSKSTLYEIVELKTILYSMYNHGISLYKSLDLLLHQAHLYSTFLLPTVDTLRQSLPMSLDQLYLSPYVLNPHSCSKFMEPSQRLNDGYKFM